MSLILPKFFRNHVFCINFEQKGGKTVKETNEI